MSRFSVFLAGIALACLGCFSSGCSTLSYVLSPGGYEQIYQMKLYKLDSDKAFDLIASSLKAEGWKVTDIDGTTNTVFAEHPGDRWWLGKATCSIKWNVLPAQLIRFDFMMRVPTIPIGQDKRVRALSDRFDSNQKEKTLHEDKT